MLIKMSIIPIRSDGNIVHEDLNIHVTRPEHFRQTLISFSGSTMAWIVLVSDNGNEYSFLRHYNGKIIDARGKEIDLESLLNT